VLELGAQAVGRRRRPYLRARPGGPPASLWPYSQALHAAVLLGRIRGDRRTSDRWGGELERYRCGQVYSSVRKPALGWRFFDDNAWVGLAAAQAAAFERDVGMQHFVRRVLSWARAGEAPGGGIRWREARAGLHACSTGAVGWLALRVNPPGTTPSAPDLALAGRCRDFLAVTLRLPGGLVADNLNSSGQIEERPWSYNQGLLIAIEVLLARAGDPDALNRAREHADLSCRWFSASDRLWKEPPCFVAVLFRALLLLDSADDDPRWPRFVDRYLDRAWTEARTASGDWSGSGIGAYRDEWTLDLAAMVQIASLRALPAPDYETLC